MKEETRKAREKQKKIIENLHRRYKYQADFARQRYDRIAFNVPKGYKDMIETETEMTAATYVKKLLLEDLSRRGLI